MKTIIKGKKIKHLYEVDFFQKEVEIDGKSKLVYYGVPSLKCKDEITYERICEVDGTLDNSLIYVSDNKRVSVDSRRFRTDLGVYEVLIDYVTSEEDVNKNESEILLAAHIPIFNEVMINSNERLRNYCEVHKLNPKETDVLKLWDVVYPENDFNIMNGEMVKVPKPGNVSNRSYDAIDW